MYLFVVSLHIILCLSLILIILLQPGKGGDVGAAFGGGGGSQMFGPRGPAGILQRATTAVAVLFMVTSVTLSMYSIKDSINEADIGGELERLEELRKMEQQEKSEEGTEPLDGAEASE